MSGNGRTVLLAHPSPDLYGSDLQLLETVSGLVEHGWRVVVAIPKEGRLLPLLRERGAAILVVPFPVLSKSLLHPRRIVGLARDMATAALGARRLLRSLRPAAVWVNTVTVPVWLLAAASVRLPSVVHVHEAEETGSRLVRTGLASPITLATTAVVNSRAAARALTDVIPLLAARLELVYNGVPAPSTTTQPAQPPQPHGGPTRIALVGRLSPRKGTDVALDAIARLRACGHDAHLDLYGAVFPGYEWFEEELRERAARPDLAGAVTFHGYVRPVARSLAQSDIVIVPSRVEPFGNVAVEAQLACRPVVVSAVQGLTEIVTDGRDGLHAEAGSADDLARVLRRLVEDPAMADALARAGHENACSRFSVERYREEIARVLAAVTDGRAAITPWRSRCSARRADPS
ncbi:glycosyltransferase family 4 protein [Salana multivorans]